MAIIYKVSSRLHTGITEIWSLSEPRRSFAGVLRFSQIICLTIVKKPEINPEKSPNSQMTIYSTGPFHKASAAVLAISVCCQFISVLLMYLKTLQ